MEDVFAAPEMVVACSKLVFFDKQDGVMSFAIVASVLKGLEQQFPHHQQICMINY